MFVEEMEVGQAGSSSLISENFQAPVVIIMKYPKPMRFETKVYEYHVGIGSVCLGPSLETISIAGSSVG